MNEAEQIWYFPIPSGDENVFEGYYTFDCL